MIPYDSLAVEGLKDVFIQISDTCKSLDIEFFIVGAIARNIWYVSNDENPRGTKDIDFAVYIADVNEYNELRAKLKERYEYTESAENAFCMLTHDGKQIDLLPFGEIEKEGQVIIEGKGLSKLNLDGFKEAFEFGVTEVQVGTEYYKSCSIPAMMILKFIAYDDRPEVRIKDVVDINSICIYYPSLEDNYIWANHFDLYDGNLKHAQVGYIVLGREMKKLVKSNERLSQRVLAILNGIIEGQNSFLSLMIQNSEKETIDMKRKILDFVRKGFSEKIM